MCKTVYIIIIIDLVAKQENLYLCISLLGKDIVGKLKESALILEESPIQ